MRRGTRRGANAITWPITVIAVLACVILSAVPSTIAAAAPLARPSPCVIGPSTSKCASSDSTLSVDWTNFADATGCVFRYLIGWGDGTSKSGEVPGGPNGSYVLAAHTYSSAGTYTESITGSVATGNCAFYPGSAQFTYAPAAFTVKGSLPVQYSSSQDTHVQAPSGSVCRNGPFYAAKAAGKYLVTTYFYAKGAPDAVTLLSNFLAGTGKPINFPDKSRISQDLPKNPAFKSLDQKVQKEVQRQLNSGAATVALGPGTLERIGLYQPADLEFSFGGTQGIVVSGSGKLVSGNYVGTLTYKIEDSYGYSTKDYFYGFGKALRYLQTVCGNPPYAGGAHWFPDSVTITVPFKLPASSS
jgi:hypothetical protein